MRVLAWGCGYHQSFVYLPKYNVCTNITYQANILAQTQLCVGTGTDHPNYATSINLGHAVETESWGTADNHQYINVNPNGCVLTAVNQYDMPTAGGTMLGVYYNISVRATCPRPGLHGAVPGAALILCLTRRCACALQTSVANDRVFNPPTACMSASVRQLRRCCCVRSAVWCPLVVPDIALPCPWACLVSCVLAVEP